MMALLAVQRPGSSLGWHDGALVVSRAGRAVRTRPLHEVDEVHLYGHVELAAAARQALLGRGVDVLFFTVTGQYRGRLLAHESPNAERRAGQYRRLADPPTALALARAVVEGKLRNQRTVLLRARRERPASGCPEALMALRQLAGQVASADNLDVLRGIEGYGARVYFRGFGQAVANDAFTFSGRTRRPPRDPINAGLSFGYTLLLTRVESAVRKAGLDPHLGVLHEPGRGKPALALDLMEELRPAVVDRLVLRLVNRRQLSPEDFCEPSARATDATDAGQSDSEPASAPPSSQDSKSSAVHLGPVGRAILLRELGSLWRRPYHYAPRQARYTLADIVDLQAMQIARLVEGAPASSICYEPFLIR